MTNTKLVIPTILVATILVAGMFAFMPVQTASTVHTTIQTNSNSQDRAFAYRVQAVGAADTEVLIPAEAGKDLVGRVVMSELVSAVASDCIVQSTDGATNILDGADNTVETLQAAIDTTGAGTPAGFTTGEGIQVVVDAGVTCAVTVFLESVTGDT